MTVQSPVPTIFSYIICNRQTARQQDREKELTNFGLVTQSHLVTASQAPSIDNKHITGVVCCISATYHLGDKVQEHHEI